MLISLALGWGAYVLFSQEAESASPTREEQYVTEDNPLQDYIAYDESFAAYHADEPLPPITLTRVSLSELTDTGYLALINRQHPARDEPDANLIISAWPTVPVSRVEGMYLHYTALMAVANMFESARAAGGMETFFVTSGFRDFYRQAYLYGDGSSAYVMPPGYSEHHTGLAADILVMGLGMFEMADATEGQWLAANSYRYGLILRYPQGSEAITGGPFEPWHFRYVGRVHAYYMMRQGFVLEQYIEYIRQNNHFSFKKNGNTHHVLHQTPQQGMIYVPYGQGFVVSGDNKGGYVIWTIIS